LSKSHRLALSVVRTDDTFELLESRGEKLWVGKCIHCNSKLSVAEDGTLLGNSSIEHIVPRNHGGDDSPDNLALACARCNQQKGVHHDHKSLTDPLRLELQTRLQRKRAQRWR
jgi:5-methylcytosine-specific restriction endonuclease McrA